MAHLPDPFAVARRFLNRMEQEALRRLIDAGSSRAAAAANAFVQPAEVMVRNLMSLISKLPNDLANWILDRDEVPTRGRLRQAK